MHPASATLAPTSPFHDHFSVFPSCLPVLQATDLCKASRNEIEERVQKTSSLRPMDHTPLQPQVSSVATIKNVLPIPTTLTDRSPRLIPTFIRTLCLSYKYFTDLSCTGFKTTGEKAFTRHHRKGDVTFG